MVPDDWIGTKRFPLFMGRQVSPWCVQALKSEHLRGAKPLTKVMFDAKLQVVQHALGTRTTISRVQGNKLKAQR